MSRLSNALSPAALIISLLALVVALSAGSAYAAVKIGTNDLKNDAVTSAKIKNKTIKPADLSKSTVAKLRGSTGPRGATGPQGPGSQKFDVSLEIGASRDVVYRAGRLYLLCTSNQIFTQLSGSAGGAINPLSLAGTTQNDEGPVAGVNARTISGQSFSGVNVNRVWADLQVADANAGEFGTLRFHATRTGTICRWQIQYIP